jgi:adenosylcobinamide-phosphate synthase
VTVPRLITALPVPMTLLCIVTGLLLEQARPAAERRYLRQFALRSASFLEDKFNDGNRRHGMIAWLLAVLPPVLALALIDVLLRRYWPLLAFVLNVFVLYITVGFRQYSHFFTDIHLALRMGDLTQARRLIAAWRGCRGDRLGSSDIARLSIEEALVASHRHVFGPVFWFVVLGPAGAVLYRLALLLNARWGRTGEDDFGAFGQFSRRAFFIVDWLPTRLTATAFAVVGDFEDAVFCWRTQAGTWPDTGNGILLASGAGALGVRLGLPISDDVGSEGSPNAMHDRPLIGLGDEADAEFMQSTIGLVWRSLVLALLLLALFWVASWVSH